MWYRPAGVIQLAHTRCNGLGMVITHSDSLFAAAWSCAISSHATTRARGNPHPSLSSAVESSRVEVMSCHVMSYVVKSSFDTGETRRDETKEEWKVHRLDGCGLALTRSVACLTNQSIINPTQSNGNPRASRWSVCPAALYTRSQPVGSGLALWGFGRLIDLID